MERVDLTSVVTDNELRREMMVESRVFYTKRHASPNQATNLVSQMSLEACSGISQVCSLVSFELRDKRSPRLAAFYSMSKWERS